jgi:hypothetical protein
MPLALLSVVDIFTNPATAWVIIPVLIFSIPILQTLVGPLNNRIKAGERDRLRQMYERLALEKLDVIKTALTMGYKQDDLAELDSRLEAVIGSDAMARLLDGKNLAPGAAGKGAFPGLSIGVNINGRKVDGALDELVHSELADGLRSSRQAERARE